MFAPMNQPPQPMPIAADAANDTDSHAAYTAHLPPHTHGATTRIWHWVNLVALVVLFMSGLMIFNAHPDLYWGEAGNRDEPSWLAIGNANEQGYLRIGGLEVETTGVLGRYRNDEGTFSNRAIPPWATIPSDYSLADARRWHFFFAWIFAFGLLLFMISSLINGHVRKAIAMRGRQWHPRVLWRTVVDHARLKFHTEAGEIYNPLQKLSYIAVIFVALPLMIITGLAMSPGVDAALHWPSMLFGGRQSARSIHFISAFALFGFLIMHVALVLIHKPLTLLRGMTIGGGK